MLLLLCRINSIDTWLILCHLHAHAGAVEGSGHAAASNVQPRSLDAFFVMRTLEPMRKRLEAAKKAEFATAQATRLTQQQLLEKEAELGLKRRRVEPDEEDKQWERWGYSDWTRRRRSGVRYRSTHASTSPCRVTASLATSTTGGVGSLAACRIEGVGPTLHRLAIDDDNEFRSRCE